MGAIALGSRCSTVIQGTFTATLKSMVPARTVTVTDGAFRVVRTNP